MKIAQNYPLYTQENASFLANQLPGSAYSGGKKQERLRISASKLLDTQWSGWTFGSMTLDVIPAVGCGLIGIGHSERVDGNVKPYSSPATPSRAIFLHCENSQRFFINNGHRDW